MPRSSRSRSAAAKGTAAGEREVKTGAATTEEQEEEAPPPPDLQAITDGIWRALEMHWSKDGLVAHQLQSYNHFIETLLPHIVSENSDVTTMSSDGQHAFYVQFTNPCVLRPTIKEADGFERPIMPHAARYRGVSYTSSVVVDICQEKVTRTATPTRVWRRVYREVVLCRLPVMVCSSVCYLSDPSQRGEECFYDRGGYFIINGHEKCLVAQEKLRTNYAYVFPAKANTRYSHVCEVRSCHELKMRSTSTLYMSTTRPLGGGIPDIVITLPFLDTVLPLPVIFKVLGACTRDEAMQYISCDGSAEMEAIVRSVFDSDPHHSSTPAEMFEWIGREATHENTRERRNRFTEHIISNELLPHMGLRLDENCSKRKLFFLGSMVRKLLLVHLGLRAVDDRDSYANKRVDAAGTLMSLLMRQLFRNYLKTISVSQHRLVESGKIETCMFGDIMTDKRITSGFKYAFATGNWGVHKNGINAQNGVAQMMSRMSILSSMSNLRRLNTPISREGKSPKPRQLHPTSYGIVCPCETPEGGGCGLVKNLALSAHVRIGCFSTPIAQMILRDLQPKVVPLLLSDAHIRNDAVHVHVNGVIIAMSSVKDAPLLADNLRKMRRRRSLPFDTSITLHDRALHIATDPGGLCRPLIIASEKHRILDVLTGAASYESTWDALLSQGIVEMIDKDEERTMTVAMRISSLFEPGGEAYTHAELSPALMLGICGSLIPFSDHNQSPRNTYQSAMGKQATGVFVTNWMRRMDAISHVLMYPQKQLVTTRVEQCLRTNAIPSGETLFVCILAYGGYNQEDSVIMNEASVQRGALRSVIQRCFKDEEKAVGADSEQFCIPTAQADCAGLRTANYDKLSSEGAVLPGVRVTANDVLIGKVISTADVAEANESRKVVKRDRSTILRHGEDSVVDAVVTSRSKDGHRSVRIRTRSTRIPQIGDKVSSRHGQKGVIGDLMPEEDMPFDPETGMRPDVIVNPHAIPSRMTIGQMVESLLGLLCCAEGRIGDGTPFQGLSIEGIADELEKAGMQRYGNRILVNGQTGERMASMVFLAPTYYQRLKHMTVDKMHARSRGPVQILTRQPVEGRSREGGLRFGEMERDCFDESHQILTAEGFCFLKDLERKVAAGERVIVGAFDPAADRLVYEPMSELVVNPMRERTMVYMNASAEAARWPEYDAPIAGGTAKRAKRADDDDVQQQQHSTMVSLAVTENHIMYYQPGTERERGGGKGTYIAWDGHERRTAGKRVVVDAPFREGTAAEMCSAGANAAFRMRTAPANGLAIPPTLRIAALESLGLVTPTALDDFLEVYGYWLGDGSLQFRAGCGTDGVAFSIVKEEDVAWLVATLERLTPHVRLNGADAYEKRLLVTDPAWVELFHGLYRSKYVMGDPNLRRPSTTAGRAAKHTQPAAPIGVKSAKWFAPFVWTLGLDGARRVIRGLRRADGCWKTPVACIFTSSVAFRDEIVRLCIHAGYAPRFVCSYKAGAIRGMSRAGIPIVARHDAWRVTFAEATKKGPYGQPVLRASNLRRVQTTTRTWCVVVPHGFVITRRALAENGVVTQASVPIVVHNCVIAHGAASVLTERLFYSSDPFRAPICAECGLLAQPETKNMYVRADARCRTCGSRNVIDKDLPYAEKLLLQELMTLGIAPRIRLTSPMEIPVVEEHLSRRQSSDLVVGNGPK